MTFRIISGVLAFTLTAVAHAQFTGNRIYVNTINYGGSSARTSLGNLATVQRFNQTTNAFDQQFSTGVFNSGTVTTEGALLFDPTSSSLWIAGYTSTLTTNTIGNTTSTSNPRIAAQILSSGTVNKFSTSSEYSMANVRSAVGIGGSVYMSGSKFGSRGYTPTGSSLGTGTQMSGAIDTRIAAFYDGVLYYSSLDVSYVGVFAGTDSTPLVTSPSPYQFRFSLDGLKTLYVADDTVGNALYGISKYAKDTNGAYVLQGTYKIPVTGTTVTSARFFALKNDVVNGLNVTTIVATTTEDTGTVPNRLVSFLDDNSFASPNGFQTLATARPNEVFRGVEVVPEPASMAIFGFGLVGLLARRRGRK